MATRTQLRLHVWLPLLVAAATVAGCSTNTRMWFNPQSKGETLAETGADHNERVRRDVDIDRRAFNEDMDLWFQTERPTRLTRWHSK